MNCSLNWSFISCGELHCDSFKIKTMINSSLFFLRQCESLDWSNCLVVLLLPATHFRKSRHARLIRGCFSFSQCFRAGVFSSLSPPPPRSLWLALSPPLFGKFQHRAFASKLRAQRKRLHRRLESAGHIACQGTLYFWLNEPDISRKREIWSDYLGIITSFHDRLKIWKSIFAPLASQLITTVFSPH